MPIKLTNVQLRQLPVRTRMPFRYGIATLREAPYLIVDAEFEIDGQAARGVAADVLPPKWFTKQADRSPESEIAEMLFVIRRACVAAENVGRQDSVFDWWQKLYELQMSDEQLQSLPPLLVGFGASLLERSAIDAFCRCNAVTFFGALRENRLGIRLGDIHPELSGLRPSDLLPKQPSRRVYVRHTIGLADPLSDDQINQAERLEDGLPHSLRECIEFYGLTHFKIKLPADVVLAANRLRNIAAVISDHGDSFAFTVDGNEFFTSPEPFREYWYELRADAEVERFLSRGLLLVEQPLHRDVALSDDVADVFSTWHDRPPLIIDESDGELGCLPRALQVGYDGTSHKNCKGVFKGVANGCLTDFLNRNNPDRRRLMTGEDLMNIGPIALLQDLAVGAALGLEHIERNGHHYVAGLSPFPATIQAALAQQHGDLYCWHETPNGSRWPRLNVNQGQIDLHSVNEAPFGLGVELNLYQFELLEHG